jgi:hypothetical protein
MGDAVYLRNGCELVERGLYLDLPAWGYHVFELTLDHPAEAGSSRS